jgi:hypothetical protein
MGQSGATDPCAVGASAFHLNSGERWTVVGHAPNGDLVIRCNCDRGESSRRLVHRDYWLGESWADR